MYEEEIKILQSDMKLKEEEIKRLEKENKKIQKKYKKLKLDARKGYNLYLKPFTDIFLKHWEVALIKNFTILKKMQKLN